MLPAAINNTDTWRYRQAEAKAAALITPTNVALFYEPDGSPSLEEIIANFRQTDIVSVEGFHF
jgi:molybdopterin-guanine dinucleotide biosynthesis protein MobB